MAKKIRLDVEDVVLRTGYGSCDFCGEEDIFGVAGQDIEIMHYPKTEHMRIPKGELKLERVITGDPEFQSRMFGPNKYVIDGYTYKHTISDSEYEFVDVVRKERRETTKPLICKSCIEQLAKLKISE